jgi:hypothetical protein
MVVTLHPTGGGNTAWTTVEGVGTVCWVSVLTSLSPGSAAGEAGGGKTASDPGVGVGVGKRVGTWVGKTVETWARNGVVPRPTRAIKRRVILHVRLGKPLWKSTWRIFRKTQDKIVRGSLIVPTSKILLSS